MIRQMVRNPGVMRRTGPVDQINNFRAGSLRKVVTFLIDLASIAFVLAAAPTFAPRTTSTQDIIQERMASLSSGRTTGRADAGS
jgi:hypothetical protein